MGVQALTVSQLSELRSSGCGVSPGREPRVGDMVERLWPRSGLRVAGRYAAWKRYLERSPRACAPGLKTQSPLRGSDSVVRHPLNMPLQIVGVVRVVESGFAGDAAAADQLSE